MNDLRRDKLRKFQIIYRNPSGERFLEEVEKLSMTEAIQDFQDQRLHMDDNIVNVRMVD